MAQPVKYLKLVGDMLTFYQKQLIRLYRKYPHEMPIDFKKVFTTNYNNMKQTQANKSISDQISLLCEPMHYQLQQPQRVNKTSIDHRQNLRSQAGNRIFRMTAGFKQHPANQTPINQSQQINDIIQSYRVQDQMGPKMRMKWKTPTDPQQKINVKQTSTFGNNNIDLLSYTIPQIQNSIRRLSLQRSPKSVKERETDIYRTLQSRSHRKKYIDRLF